VYEAGAKGVAPLHEDDGSDKSELYKMLHSLSEELRSTGYPDNEGWYDFADWQAFCKVVVQDKED